MERSSRLAQTSAEAASASAPNPSKESSDNLPILDNLPVVEPLQGWERRFVADVERAREAIQLYEEMGYEVQLQEIAGLKLTSNCVRCFDARDQHVIVYTRRRAPASIQPGTLNRRKKMTDPITELMDEHRAIEKVLEALTAAAQTDIDLAFYERALDFIVNFADRCHHSKEEERLFPVLEERGVPRQGGPIGCMVDEHEVGRAHVRRMRQHIEAENRDGLRQESLEYVALLRAHIQKEDFVLFPMGQTVLTDDDQSLLRSRFDEVETAHPEFQRYYQVAEDLLAEAKGQAV